MKKANLSPMGEYVNSTTPWRCSCDKCGKEVTPTLASVRRGAGGCVYCAGMVVTPEDAIALFVSNGLTPLEPYKGAGNKWKAIHVACGREVQPTYSNVRSGHSGCKYCVGNIVDEVKARSFFISRGLLPLEPYKNALTPWRAIHQQCGREVRTKFNTVQQGSSGCIYCGGNARIEPADAEKYFRENGLEPLEPFVSTGMPWKSRHLACGREVTPRYSAVQQGGSGCKYCAKVYVDPDEALSEMRKFGFEPLHEYRSSSEGWKAVHVACGRAVSPTLGALRRGSSSGCAYCSRQRVDPNVAKELFISKGLIPQVSFPGARVGWESIHARCGKLVSPKYADVSTDSNGCKFCAPNFVDVEEALAIFRAADLEPIEPYPGADKGWRSIHRSCGREVSPRFGYVRRNQAGCAYCAGKLVHPDEAKLFMLSKGLTPLVGYSGAQTPWRCLHEKCGREVTPTYSSVKWNQNGGCRYCADSTFNYAAPAVLYLITHDELGSHKIGIGNADKTRVEQHQKHGWKVFKTLAIETGEDAYLVEQSILLWLKNELGLYPYLSKSEMPQGGFTETFNASEIRLPDVWREVERKYRAIKSSA
jgi:hypothetical protein